MNNEHIKHILTVYGFLLWDKTEYTLGDLAEQIKLAHDLSNEQNKAAYDICKMNEKTKVVKSNIWDRDVNKMDIEKDEQAGDEI